MTAASVWPFKICHNCHSEVENEATNGPGISLSGEKYLLPMQIETTKIVPTMAAASRIVAASSGSFGTIVKQ
jgi:hypothetical protein